VSRRPAALRHLAWTLALAAALLAPLLVRVVPLRLPLIPLQRSAVQPDQTDVAPITDGARRIAESPDPAQLPPAPSEAAAREARTPITLTGLAPVLWLSVTGLLGLRLLGSFVALARIARRTRPLETPDWHEQLARGCERLGIKVQPRLLMTERISIPCIAGWLRPVILLPPSALDWSPDRREVVLLHELAHLKRRDIVAHLFGQAACMIHWFNPLVWIAARRQRADAEQACDDLVIGSGARPSEYADRPGSGCSPADGHPVRVRGAAAGHSRIEGSQTHAPTACGHGGNPVQRIGDPADCGRQRACGSAAPDGRDG
jgi:beta-lactamase regulating signal transducer with metallopeptidase domain